MRLISLAALLYAASMLNPLSTWATAQTASASRTPPAALNVGFAGEWTGQLQYRDYSSDQRVFLPTWLTIVADPGGHSLRFAYTFDDGPAKVVRERLLVELDAAAKTVTTSDPDKTAEAAHVFGATGFEQFAQRGRGTLVLSGTDTDNGKPADVRITVTLYRNLLTWLKETRPAHSTEAYVFRDQYTLTRRLPPS